jgi:hypothetical protein
VGPTATPTPEPGRFVELVAVGDIILHQSVIDGGLVTSKPEPAYNYTPAFQYIRPIIEAAAGPAITKGRGRAPYSGYRFSARRCDRRALLGLGIRRRLGRHQPHVDKGLEGVIRTANVFAAR